MIGGGKTPTLSELLREAKGDSESLAKSSEAGGSEQTPISYSRLFDEYKGAEMTIVTLENASVLTFVKPPPSRCCTSRSFRPALKGMRIQGTFDKLGVVSSGVTCR